MQRAFGYESANARPRIAVVGCGSRWGWQLANGGSYGVGVDFARCADYVAVCDVDQQRVDAARRLVREWNGSDPDVLTDYRAIIDRDDVDAILVFTPDHWHAKIAIEAMRSGKDVYCEKPLTLTIREGRQLCDVCRDTGRVVQVGTQQRSLPAFQVAAALVRAGRLGDLVRVECGIGGAPTSPALPVAKPPTSLDWDRWLGPAPWSDFRFLEGAQNETKSWSRCHYEFRWWYDYSGGKLTDWGAHHVDIATWAMGQSESGPMRVEPVDVVHPVEFREGYPTVQDRYNTATRFRFEIVYEKGPTLSLSSEARNGILIEGTEGRIFVNRRSLSGAPVERLESEPLPESALQEVNFGFSNQDESRGSASFAHVENFFDAVATRSRPNSDVFSHHRALSTCHLAAIAGRLGRTIKWDPDDEQVIDDPQAQDLLGRESRRGYDVEG